MRDEADGHKYWRLVAGVENTRYFQRDKRPSVGGWTCPPNSQRGDLAVLYSKSPGQDYVAIARQCTDPVKNKGSDYFGAIFQFQPLQREVAHAEIAKLASTQVPGSGLNTASGGGYNEIAPGRGRQAFLRRLVRGDERAAERLEQWASSTARYPRDLDRYGQPLEDYFEPPEKVREGELRLAQQIADRLVRSGKARRPLPEDGIHDGDGLEVRVNFKDGYGRADIVLVSERHVRSTLLLIEVKIAAHRNPPMFNPVEQVADYRWALERQIPARWRIRPWVIAREIPPAVRAQARSERIPCSVCDENGGRLRTVVGTAPV